MPTRLALLLIVGTALALPSTAQVEVHWSASSGYGPEDAAPSILHSESLNACGVVDRTLTSTSLTLDTSACPDLRYSLVQILDEPTLGPPPSTLWLETRLRVVSTGGTGFPFGPAALRLAVDQFFPCEWIVELYPQEIRLLYGGSHPWFFGSAAVDLLSAPVTLRLEVDTATTACQVFVDGQLVLNAPSAPSLGCSSFSQRLWALGDFSSSGSSVIEIESIAHNFAPYAFTYCEPTTANSLGFQGSLSWSGSRQIADGDLTLLASGLPAGSFGYVLASAAVGGRVSPPGAQGVLCLGGPIGRFNRPGEVLVADPTGAATLAVDPMNVPQPTGAVAVQPGESWSFQLWYRDANPAVTSNTTNVVRIAFS